MDAKEFAFEKEKQHHKEGKEIWNWHDTMEEYTSYKLQEQRNRHLIIGILSGLFVVVSCIIGGFIVTSLL